MQVLYLSGHNLKTWHITCLSPIQCRRVINSQKQSRFFGSPCIVVMSLDSVFHARLCAKFKLFYVCMHVTLAYLRVLPFCFCHFHCICCTSFMTPSLFHSQIKTYYFIIKTYLFYKSFPPYHRLFSFLRTDSMVSWLLPVLLRFFLFLVFFIFQLMVQYGRLSRLSAFECTVNILYLILSYIYLTEVNNIMAK